MKRIGTLIDPVVEIGNMAADVEKGELISMLILLIKEIVKNYGTGNSQKAGLTSALRQ